ncbi:ATP-binding cassette transporter [Polyporus arcularius HHB13444]|uniref:ATP-binding cassette transporter n=1 Tax=Polyporus arcularius HHB13444 TaxID=1314778 RepID=A0A5C3PCF5_9APHY|nr:ATP-binding cassette transporter [Polyporus arcularius HHB13444]
MAEYQLHVAITLTAGLTTSIAVLCLAGPRKTTTELPTSLDGTSSLLRDPFDITKPEDFVDGIPIDADGFWRRVRRRKLALGFVLAHVLAIECIDLGLSMVHEPRLSATAYGLHVAFALYTFVLSVYATSRTGSQHAHAITHLSALTALATALYTLIAILPSAPLPTISSFSVSVAVYSPLWYTAYALYAAALGVASTTPRGPKLHFPPEEIYSDKGSARITSRNEDNVSGIASDSVLDLLLFSYTTRVAMLGKTVESIEIGDLSILTADMRATTLYASMRSAMKRWKLHIGSWSPKRGSGVELGYRLLRVNAGSLVVIALLSVVVSGMFYVPAFFVQRVVHYLEVDPTREHREWGYFFSAALLFGGFAVHLVANHLWSLTVTTLQVRFRIQLNTLLFAKTLVRKNITSTYSESDPQKAQEGGKTEDKPTEEFSSKAQVMTLMTTDVDRVASFALHLFTIIDAPLEILIATIYLYRLLGVSCFFGLGVILLSLPINHFAGSVVVGTQTNLMKARDERVSLMNEVLAAIRMLKFMAWERSFERRVESIRERELRYQKKTYTIEVLFRAIWNATPILVTLVSFWHYAVVRKQVLTPSIAFTSISVFNEMKFAMGAVPETVIKLFQSGVSLRRIETYLEGAEITPVLSLDNQPRAIATRSATLTWAQERSTKNSPLSSVPSTPQQQFMLKDLTLDFPVGELSLVCGKLGSGKSLLLLSLLGEADVLSGEVICPRTPPSALASFAGVVVPDHEWVVQGVCAYVPQSAWLRNASIKDNILFDLPYVEERYQKTLEACALVSDLDILEDGDESEIGERGVNLSGGQKARVSLARAVYSRASTLFLDDVLSAVDAHTARHLYQYCLKGDLMRGRTVILVSHHVQLCASGAKYIVSLDNGRVQYSGDYSGFERSDLLETLTYAKAPASIETKAALNPLVEENADVAVDIPDGTSTTPSVAASDVPTLLNSDIKPTKKPPRKLVEDEKREVGGINKDIWTSYLAACGGWAYWVTFAFAVGIGATAPVLENGWLRIWSGSYLDEGQRHSPAYYIGIYAAISIFGLIITTARWLVFYYGGIHASFKLHHELLESVLFANIRFHDTSSRGRLLNRFGKDIEGIDSSLPDDLARSIICGLSSAVTVVTLTIVGGPLVVLTVIVLGFLFFTTAKAYNQTNRDLRRLDSVTRSPLYSIYGETISGAAVVRAFGASSKFLRDMLRFTDTNANPYYWMWGVNRWLITRYCLLTAIVMGAMAFIAVFNPKIDASLAGFTLTFASSLLNDLVSVVRRYVSLEQSLVSVERVKEYSELPSEGPEYIEPRPPTFWPSDGAIKCENLVGRYSPELPNVLHGLSFEIKPGEKVGVLGRTGSGKSTLALSFFRFVEPVEGRILIDGIDISKIGLTDLRSRLTIIPQDPTILSGTLRSTLDVFNEYEDAEIYEALRRVHLIPSGDEPDAATDAINANVFRNLDSPVSEGGENFSAGEKQLLCMARAILKRAKVLLMDEATASVDYATDELIGKTIRQEFAHSTILTIAHRLRTVIDYDRVLLLEQGKIVEFDNPAALLSNPKSSFYALCKATGKQEFVTLKRLAGL